MLEPLSEQDQKEWNYYIDRLFNSPPSEYIPLKEQIGLKTRLDLHGMTLSEAHGAVNNFVSDHAEAATESVVVITGKSGQINYEFQEWCKQLKSIRNVEPIVDSRGQIGSYRIWIKKPKTKM